MFVTVNFGVRQLGELEIPFITVLMPPGTEAMAEIRSFEPEALQLADPGVDSILLRADGIQMLRLTEEIGDMLTFLRSIKRNPVMLISLYTWTQDDQFLLNRTLVSDALDGRILSDTGPQRLERMEPGEELEELEAAKKLQSLAELCVELDTTGRGAPNRRLDPSRAN